MGKPIKPPLTPLPVTGPFDRIGVDVIKFPRSARGNKYAVVFMDYLRGVASLNLMPGHTFSTYPSTL